LIERGFAVCTQLHNKARDNDPFKALAKDFTGMNIKGWLRYCAVG
jgi:hypothetical protein